MIGSGAPSASAAVAAAAASLTTGSMPAVEISSTTRFGLIVFAPLSPNDVPIGGRVGMSFTYPE